MGYETINKNHHWVADNLEMAMPVPDEHIQGANSINCKYFQEANSEKEAVPYLKVKKDGKVECKVHSRISFLCNIFQIYLRKARTPPKAKHRVWTE